MKDIAYELYYYLGGELLEFAATQPPLRPLVRHFRPQATPHPLLFIHVPRNAGTSIRAAMGTGHAGHRTLSYYRAVYPDELSRKTTFAVVRDPVSRFRSAYQFIVGRGAEQAGLNPLNRLTTRHIKSVDDFLHFLEDRKRALDRLDPVMRTQANYVVDDASGRMVDALFCLETRTSFLSEFLRDHGFHALEQLNRSARANSTLTRKQIRRVELLYAQDMELYEKASSNMAA